MCWNILADVLANIVQKMKVGRTFYIERDRIYFGVIGTFTSSIDVHHIIHCL
ncbi:hypothetical protein D3C72_1426380 [compost metagenome]